MTVTNGTVEYARTTRPADFESKQAKVTLSFNIEDGSDTGAVVANVFDLAVAEVHRRLGLAPVQQQSVKRQAKPAPAAEVPAENPPVSPAETGGADHANAGAPSAASDDPTEIEIPETEPKEREPIQITDKDLQHAIHLARQAHVAGKQINEVTLSITGVVGKGYSTLTQEQRVEWLARVKALHPEKAA